MSKLKITAQIGRYLAFYNKARANNDTQAMAHYKKLIEEKEKEL